MPGALKTILPRRRALLLGAAAALAASALPVPASEVGKLYVGFAAGGATDTLARLIAPALSSELGQTFIVENVPGASGMLAAKAVERSTPRQPAYVLYPTMTMLGKVLAGQPSELDKLTPISLLYEQFTLVVVNPQVPGLENVRTLQDLLQVAKAKPGLTYGPMGVGSTGHLTMEWLNSLAGVKMQAVPYKGGAPAMADLLGGHIGVLIADSTVVAPHLNSGKVRAIAVNYPQRMASLPDVPTIQEQGFKEIAGVPWVVLAGPPGMPQQQAAALAKALDKVLAQPELVQAMRAQNVEPRSSSPKEATQLMQGDLALWSRIIKDNHITNN
ncbi:Tripartite-type tricarboxylate transporter, receptor component TctC [Oryzisolibacter propanilivorax]|uniref:Tripartite-type tricarboxylate transporter, receptor component TctC n=1 Tax=Oryzisolibacter propanilivorax TaxID=1527607 RepID=A0A1G9Q4B8_9BURK|nr:tripartite tricarboxylate transporter substrate binding protein [Oryzisolibacter propanilivorax]SDM05819.1 Tripartite-type tricarboxylate transporter, receptor component TctC [Oryzisolibacter propanilivorax]